MNSLRARLLLIIGGSLVILWGAVAAWMLVQLRTEMRTALDERLAASARMVAGLATQFAPAGSAGSAAAAGLVDVVARDGLACEVSLIRGELSIQKVARTAAAPPMEQAGPGYSTRVFGGKLWRTYVLQQGGIRVATADRLDVRESLLQDVVLAAAVPFGVALVGTLATLWFGIAGGLSPLERMRKVLAARRPDDNAALPTLAVPLEMRPLVDTISSLLARVRSTLERERRFADDAAHELRTPLTAVKTHLQVLGMALRDCHASPGVNSALGDANEAVHRMQHTVEQLLMLARADRDRDADSTAVCDAHAAATKAARDAQSRLGPVGRVLVQARAGEVQVAMPEALLATALRNLLENALRIAPPPTPVLLRVCSHDGFVHFSVLDEGPGLTEEQCALAPQRFWKAAKGSAGSGLGLSITSSIAMHYGGRLELAPRRLRGLRATFSVPAAGA